MSHAADWIGFSGAVCGAIITIIGAYFVFSSAGFAFRKPNH